MKTSSDLTLIRKIMIVLAIIFYFLRSLPESENQTKAGNAWVALFFWLCGVIGMIGFFFGAMALLNLCLGYSWADVRATIAVSTILYIGAGLGHLNLKYHPTPGKHPAAGNQIRMSGGPLF